MRPPLQEFGLDLVSVIFLFIADSVLMLVSFHFYLFLLQIGIQGTVLDFLPLLLSLPLNFILPTIQ